MVIYTADQGCFLGEHGFFDKRLIYLMNHYGCHLLFGYPKEIEAGKRLDDIIMNIDFPALFADYADVEIPASMQGKSFKQNLPKIGEKRLIIGTGQTIQLGRNILESEIININWLSFMDSLWI